MSGVPRLRLPPRIIFDPAHVPAASDSSVWKNVIERLMREDLP